MPIEIDSKIWWILGLSIAGMYTLQTVTLGVSFSAQEAAHKAQLAAERARPHPYTSLDHDRYRMRHNEEHRQEHEHQEKHSDSGDRLLKAEVMLAIGNLDIPPEEVEAFQKAIESRVSRLEHKMEN